MSSPKYPRTPHLPSSPGATRTDRQLDSVDHLLGPMLIFTEKMDGSNVSLESHNVYARSHIAAPKHPSFDALKARHAALQSQIPDGTQIFCEWLYAKHSLHYSNLPNHLMMFAVCSHGIWGSWEEVEMWSDDLGIPTVPVLKKRVVDRADLLASCVEDLTNRSSEFGCPREGVVVRVDHSFLDAHFSRSVAKYVRANHVQTDEHWTTQKIVRNRLKGAR